MNSPRVYCTLSVVLLLVGAINHAQATYVNEVLQDAPLGYWRLEEASGAVAGDASGNALDGTYDNVGLGSAGVPGIGGAAGSFNGTSSGVNLPGAWGGPTMSAMTIEAWVNVASNPGTFQAVVSADTTHFAHFQLFSGAQTGTYTNTGFVGVASPAPTPLNQWRHLALVSESGNTRIYENGVQVGVADSTAFSSFTASSNVDIGRGYAGGRHFNGLIDEVAIYDTALSSDRIRSHYVAGNLLAHYKFDGNANDSAAGGHHGTLGGGASITNESRIGTGALDLRGVQGFVDVANPLLAGLPQYSIAMWLNADALNAACCDALVASDGFSMGDVHVNATGGVTQNAVAGTTPYANSTSVLPLDEWVHVAFTYDSIAGQAIAYIDGNAETTLSHTTGVAAFLDAMTIGAWDTTGAGAFARFFDGRIDDLRIYGTVLTGDEILALASMPAHVPEPTTWALLVLGGLFVAPRLRRRK